MNDKTKTDAWMPLWIGAYLADTMRLTTIQHGAYLLLLMAYWRERAALPDDDTELRAITKTEKSEWKQIKPVLAKFFKIENGVWWHKRVEQEMAAADARSEKSSSKAAKAAQARWGHQSGDAPSNAPGNAPSIPQALPEDVIDECPTPPPLPNEEEQANACLSPAKPPTCPHHALIDLFGQHLPTLPQPKKELWSGANEEAMRARWRWVLTATKSNGKRYAETAEQGIDWFGRFFVHVEKSDFLMGRTEKPWTACDLGWLMKAANFTKVVQGNYDNKGQA